ncbi:MAG TPA: tetratricopeptide repeat protein [Luteolibacter sp.]|nr:tetratricopeptide repeat protein [Luteolibacter sp.]
MKWIAKLVLLFLVLGAWWVFANKGKEIEKLERQITHLEETDFENEELPKMRTNLDGLEGERTFSGILLTFLTAGLVGIVFVFVVLPMMAHKVTHAVYDSAEMIERDVMHDARVLVAQGEFEAAIEAFKEAAQKEPLNRLPWVEIAKIQKDNLEDPHAAIATIRGALEGQEWEINDAAYFMFRLAELYDGEMGERESAVAILQQVVEQFPRTRHSANAKTRLHEWGCDEVIAPPQPQVASVQPPPPEEIRYELPGIEDDSENRG